MKKILITSLIGLLLVTNAVAEGPENHVNPSSTKTNGTQPRVDSSTVKQSNADGVPLKDLVKDKSDPIAQPNGGVQADHKAQVRGPSAGKEDGGTFELIVESVDPQLIHLTNDQVLALMQESMRNAQLAEQLQGEPRKMLLERNNYIAQQLVISAQSARAKELNSRLSLQITPAKAAEVIHTVEQALDWSRVGDFERWIGATFLGMTYPQKAQASLKRHFYSVTLRDGQRNESVSYEKHQQLIAKRNDQPVPTIMQDDGNQALVSWSEQFGQNTLSFSLLDSSLPELHLGASKTVSVEPLDAVVSSVYASHRWSLLQKAVVGGVIAALVAVACAVLTWVSLLMRDGLRYRKLQQTDNKTIK